MYDTQWQRDRHDAETRRRLRRTWPALLFTTLFVAVLTVSVGVGVLLLVASRLAPGPHPEWFPWGPAAAVGLAIGLLGWIALRLFLGSRGSPTHGVRHALVLGAAASLGALTLVSAHNAGFVLDYSNRMPMRDQARAIDQAYQRETAAATARWEQTLVETMGEDGLMNGHLHGRRSIPDVRLRIDVARRAIVQHDTDIEAARVNVYHQIEEATLNPFEKAQLRDGFESGFAWTDSYRRDGYELNRRILDGLEAQLDILDASPGRWEITGDRILFEDEQTLADYNRSQRELMYIVAELDAHDRRVAEASAELDATAWPSP